MASKESSILKSRIEKLLKGRLNNQFLEKKHLSGSELHNCSRMLYYELMNIKKEENFNTRFQLALDNGSFFHERMENYLKELEKAGELKIVSMEEKVMDEKNKLSGKLDALVNIDGVNILIEFKSMNSSKFMNLDEPLEEHTIQLHAYLILFEKYNIQKMIIIYENKNNHELKEFEVDIDKKIVEKIKDKLIKVYSHFEKKKPPEREYKRTDYHCIYCPYYKHCYEDEN
jgi:CRISPR-associated protein Cas4